MGGCCAHAPGTLGPAASRGEMVDGITSSDSREAKSNGSSCGGGDFSELTAGDEGAEGTRTSVFQVLRAGGAQESCSTPPVEKGGTTVDVEKLLRVLEVAVEREYADGLRDRFNASNEYRENAESLHSSLAESATSVHCLPESAFSKSCFNNSSTGAGESCSLEQENGGSTNNHGLCEGKQGTGSDWAERVEVALESMHHMQRRDPNSELKARNTKQIVGDKTLGNFERILQQILTLESEEKSAQPRPASPCRSQPDVLTEFDDYPRGSSDTNSEEAERDRKTVCSIPVINSIFPTNQAGTTTFLSLGVVQRGEKQGAIPTSCLFEGSVRLDKSDSTTDQARQISHRPIESLSSSFETDQSGAGGVDDSYANWLDRHSKELGWKNRRMANLSEHETCIREHGPCTEGESKVGLSGLKLLQRQVNGFDSDCRRSWTSQGDLAEFEFHTRDDQRTSTTHLKGGEPSRRNAESVDDLETNCSTSARGQGIQEHVLKFCSFQPGEHGQGSFKFPDIQLENNYSASLRNAIQIRNPSYFFPRNNIQHLQDWARADLSDRAKVELGRSCNPAITDIAPIQSTSPRCASEYGGAKILRNPHLLLETQSNGSRGRSKLNSRVETPKSVLSGGRAPESNTNHREKVKVCVRMRPFNDLEKICPLRQLLCVMGEKVIVKEYDRPPLRRSIDSSDTDLLEFRVDCVVDDSYLQKFRAEKKEDSQTRMFESIGVPCLEFALDGYNTTVLAYGPVGTGKTYTMMGDGFENGSGLMPRLAKELMNQLKKEFEGEFEVQVSYLEIYQEKIRDLLAAQKLELQDSRCGSMRNCTSSCFDCSEESTYENSVDYDTTSHASFCVGTPRSWRSERIPSVYFDNPFPKKGNLRVREHPVTGPYVEGLLWKNVTTWQDLEAVMLQGAAKRTLAPTPLNKLSSRGHTLFTIKLIRGGRRFVNGCPNSSFSVINLVDLAGTEKPQSAKKAPLERLDESRYINRSIAQLNDVYSIF
ncbi:unnamed protein product [Calypogeia fissa]